MDVFRTLTRIVNRITVIGTGSGGRITDMESHIREVEKVRLLSRDSPAMEPR